MGSRIRENPEKLFECFVEIVPKQDGKPAPWVLQKFPDDYNDQEILKSVPYFCYPCDITSTVVQVFSFVLTGADGKWTFGYCRHTPKAPTAICLLSSLPWHETFYELLNRIAEITHRKEASALLRFLEALYETELPEPGGSLVFNYAGEASEQVFLCTDHNRLPSIPENRNFNEYFNAVTAQNMMIIFASMLNERRIMITSEKLSRLSACVQSANALIYPMSWQHIYIPILPANLIDYLSAPMPFLIGVPSTLLDKAPNLDLNEIVVLYADRDKVETPFDDLQCLPQEIVSQLKRRLKNPTAMLGDRVARAFLFTLVQLIGGYRDALDFGEKITFNRDAFIQARTPSMQAFLERMLQLQIFQQFIEDRLNTLNAGEGFKDEFESEVDKYADKNSTKLRNQYKEWMSNVRKEGGAFFKSVKKKANPAVKHAYKSVKDRGKKAYKGVRDKIQELQQKEVAGNGLPSPGHLNARHPRSAPSSPTLVRSRPNTFHGIKFNWEKFSHTNEKPAKQYNLLAVNELMSPDEGTQNDVDQVQSSGESSPSLTHRRVSINLLDEMQDIFNKCKINHIDVDDKSLKGAASGESLYEDSPVSSSAPTHYGDGIIPIPPPRSKRRGIGQLGARGVNQISTSPEPASMTVETQRTQEKLLIQLEAEADEEEIFDPLLLNKPISSEHTKTAEMAFSNPGFVQQSVLPSRPVDTLPMSFHSNMAHSAPSYGGGAVSSPYSQFTTFKPPSVSTTVTHNMHHSNFTTTTNPSTVPINDLFTVPSSQSAGIQTQIGFVPMTSLPPTMMTKPFAVPSSSQGFGGNSSSSSVVNSVSSGVAFQSTNPFANYAPPPQRPPPPQMAMVNNSDKPATTSVNNTIHQQQQQRVKSPLRPSIPPPPRPIPVPQNRNTVANPFPSWGVTAPPVADNKTQWETFN